MYRHGASAMSRLRHIDDNFDVVRVGFERFGPSFKRHAAGDQAAKPLAVGACECVSRTLIVPPIGVDRPEHDIVIKYQGAIEAADIEGDRVAWIGHSSEACDPCGGGAPEHEIDDGGRPRTLHDDVG